MSPESSVLRRSIPRHRKCGNKSRKTSVRERKFQKISVKLAVCCLLYDENQQQNKHVESLRIACLDEGSNPSNSTKAVDNQQITTIVPIFTPTFQVGFFLFFLLQDKRNVDSFEKNISKFRISCMIASPFTSIIYFLSQSFFFKVIFSSYPFAFNPNYAIAGCIKSPKMIKLLLQEQNLCKHNKKLSPVRYNNKQIKHYRQRSYGTQIGFGYFSTQIKLQRSFPAAKN